MLPSVQLNTRISPRIKEQGDAVFSRAGLSSSDVVRGVWKYAATHQDIPDFLKERADQSDVRAQAIRHGAGLARRLGGSMGYCVLDEVPIGGQVRDDMYDSIMAAMDKNHVEA